MLVSQVSFGGETSGGVAKCRLFSQASHSITPDNGKVIRLILAENTLQRKIKEAVEIKTSCASLNLDGGPELGNTYDAILLSLDCYNNYFIPIINKYNESVLKGSIRG